MAILSNMAEGTVLRFNEEAQISSQLEHPNIVPVHELGVDEHDQVFYVMKLVPGVTLRQVLEKLRAARREKLEESSAIRALGPLPRERSRIHDPKPASAAAVPPLTGDGWGGGGGGRRGRWPRGAA